MPKYKVVAEFIDKFTGCRKQPGDVIEVSEERSVRLKKAEVISAEIIKDRLESAAEQQAQEIKPQEARAKEIERQDNEEVEQKESAAKLRRKKTKAR